MSQYYSKGGSFNIIKGSINDTQIDMNLRKITSLGDPVNDFDAVNKRTLDNAVPTPLNLRDTQVINMIGTNEYILNTSNIGKYEIDIKPNVPPNNTSSPTTQATIFKSKQQYNGKILGFYNTSDTGNTRIRLKWNPNEQVRIFKTNNNNDGEYIVTIFFII